MSSEPSNIKMPDYEELFNKEKKRCPHTEKAYLIAINDIAGKPACKEKHILLLFPEGMMSSADLNANIPSHTNQPTQLFIQKLFNKAKIDGEEHEQCFHPSSFWVLHILNDRCCLLKHAQTEDVDNFKKAFEGMTM